MKGYFKISKKFLLSLYACAQDETKNLVFIIILDKCNTKVRTTVSLVESTKKRHIQFMPKVSRPYKELKCHKESKMPAYLLYKTEVSCLKAGKNASLSLSLKIIQSH